MSLRGNGGVVGQCIHEFIHGNAGMGGDFLPRDVERQAADSVLVGCSEGSLGFPASGCPGFESFIVITNGDRGVVELEAMLQALKDGLDFGCDVPMRDGRVGNRGVTDLMQDSLASTNHISPSKSQAPGFVQAGAVDPEFKVR